MYWTRRIDVGSINSVIRDEVQQVLHAHRFLPILVDPETAPVSTDSRRQLGTADWITKVGKLVKELRDSARGDKQGRQDGNARAESGAEHGEDRKKTAAANAAYKKLGHKIAERLIASYLPRLPANDYKIIIRPKCSLALTKVPNTRLSEAVRMAAQIPWIKGQEKEVLIVNDKQGTLIFSSPDIDTVWKVTRIKSIKIEGKKYDVTAYLAPHEESGRGVVRSIDPRLSVE
ncbi:hypothetical protein HPB51_026356 [Rhipicephalus microplus]|uniref:Uncharacterized protein n=1 Tax=Rhipicephalus microplus TaxID=6941 RepID=A0A9J6D3B0_RHIMP|nr:hypothetical protein HPB51_026356 [Rhipicephalus microplus]